MYKKMLLLGFGVIIFSLGCASTAPLKRSESVTIMLKNGDKIKADVLDIFQDKIIFKTNDWKKAYEYGEVINIERITGIKIADGTRLSVKEFDAYRKGGIINSRKKRTNNALVYSPEFASEDNSDYQYEELKKKPIAEMTDNEFRFFMMMKDRELIAESEAALREKNVKPTESRVKDSTDKEPENITVGKSQAKPAEIRESKPATPAESPTGVTRIKFPQNKQPRITVSNDSQLEQVVNSLLESELAPSYLYYLSKKNHLGRSLTIAESAMLKLIEENSKWQEQIEEIKYIDRTAQKTLSRAYLHAPDALQTKLELKFDPDLDMDYFGLMDQLHRKIGEDVKMGDFRVMVDVLGESGGRAVKEILENYATWQFILKSNKSFANK